MKEKNERTEISKNQNLKKKKKERVKIKTNKKKQNKGREQKKRLVKKKIQVMGTFQGLCLTWCVSACLHKDSRKSYVSIDKDDTAIDFSNLQYCRFWNQIAYNNSQICNQFIICN